MAMRALREGASGGFLKFILMGLLVMAVGGLVLMDVGGFFRGGVSSNDAAKIGSETIPITRFDSNVRRTLSRIGISAQEAYQQGYINQILSGEVRARIMDQTANKYGIEVSQENIAHHIKGLVTPLLQPGQSPSDVLGQILNAQAMSESEFAESIGREMTNTLLYDSIEAGFTDMSEDIIKDIIRYRNETRDITYIPFKTSEMEAPPAPEEDTLREFYEAQKPRFVIPETRDVVLLSIDDSALKKTLEISDEDITATYEAEIDLYSSPETIAIEQAIVSDMDKAKAIADAASSAKTLEAAVKEATGNTVAYLGEKGYEPGDMLEELQAAVDENKAEGAIIGPVKTPLGWSVVRITSITPAEVRPLSEVKDDIRDELMQTQLIDQLYALAGQLDDALAMGQSIEEIKQQIDLVTIAFDGINRFGQNMRGENVFADHADIREEILENAFELLEGETSLVTEMADGNLSAVHVAQITPMSYKPFEEVRAQLLQNWTQQQKQALTKNEVMEILAANIADQKPLADLAKELKKTPVSLQNVGRKGKNKGDLSTEAVSVLFETQAGKQAMVKIAGGFAIAEVIEINVPDEIDTSSDLYQDTKASLIESAQNAAPSLFLTKHGARTGAMINERLIESVYGATEESY